MTSSTQYEYYAALHNDFSEAYKAVNEYVITLYAMPKKFIEETGPALDRFIREYSVPGSPRYHDLSARAVLDFISDVDTFTANTIELFECHKKHVDSCVSYMQKVSHLDAQHATTGKEHAAHEYVKLTADLQILQNSLTEIKLRADNMVHKLGKLENRWVHVQPRLEV